MSVSSNYNHNHISIAQGYTTLGPWKDRMWPSASHPECVNFGTKVVLCVGNTTTLHFKVLLLKVGYKRKNVWLCQ